MIINKTNAVDISIQLVVPVSIGVVSVAKAGCEDRKTIKNEINGILVNMKLPPNCKNQNNKTNFIL